jgi:hypothetical protein
VVNKVSYSQMKLWPAMNNCPKYHSTSSLHNGRLKKLEAISRQSRPDLRRKLEAVHKFRIRAQMFMLCVLSTGPSAEEGERNRL